jgi:hypothetical protein
MVNSRTFACTEISELRLTAFSEVRSIEEGRDSSFSLGPLDS